MRTRTIPDGVSLTAVSVAAARLREHRRPEALFADPLAGAFVAAVQGLYPENFTIDTEGNPDVRANAEHVAVRTVFFDEALLDAVEAGCRQVVILAAGLDTRAFRLAWPAGVRVFELDLPNLVQFKEPIVASENAVPACERTVVSVDLLGDWASALAAAGFDADLPTAWLAEGLLPYLDQTACSRLLSRARELSAPGSVLALEHFSRPTVEQIMSRPAMAVLGELDAIWKSTLEDPQSWLTGLGWRPDVHRSGDVAARRGRQLDPDYGSVWLVRADAT